MPTANQIVAKAVSMGFPVNSAATNSTTLALSAAGTWLALQFVAQQAKTLNAATLYMSAKTGTPAASELTCDLYSDSSGIPGSSIESRPADSVPAAGNRVSWSGFATVLTAGAAYWMVFKNTNASPASNFPTYQYSVGWIENDASDLLGTYGWNKVHTTNSGTAWATSLSEYVAGLRIQYSDGTYDGAPINSSTRPGGAASTERAFGKQEVGVYFNLPGNAKYNAAAVACWLNKVGSPGALQFRLYQGASLLGTTVQIPATNVSTGTGGSLYRSCFSPPIPLDPANNPFRFTVCDATAADTSSNGYNLASATWDSDANSLSLKPMDGSCKETTTTDNTASPPVFTENANNVMAFSLLLDSAGEFSAGGGLLRHPGMTGGLHA